MMLPVMAYVARRYYFQGTHHVPGLPAPWNDVHSHRYTVEVVARQPAGEPTVVDTDLIDRAWAEQEVPDYADLDELYGPENTTVEALSMRWLEELHSYIDAIYRVVVWEDDTRWGATELG